MPLYSALSVSHVMVSTHRLEPGLPFCEVNPAALSLLGISPFEDYSYYGYQSFIPKSDYNQLLSIVNNGEQGTSYSMCYRLFLKQAEHCISLTSMRATLYTLNGLVIILAQTLV